MSDKILSIVVPLYNEEKSINELLSRVTTVLETITSEFKIDWEILFVNDGSRDNTLAISKELAKEERRLKIISLSRNFGHQNAVTAGLEHATGDCAVIIDADLQDPPELIPEMIRLWQEGNKVVYATRESRKSESIFKKITAQIFYRGLNRISEVNIPVDTGDFRLVDRVIIDTLKDMPERNRFIRGLVSWAGFKQCSISYKRDGRYAGETKYPLSKMIKFAVNGITSFSTTPLIVAMYLGFAITAIAFIAILWIVWLKLFTDNTIQGWASQLTAVIFFGGIQLLSTGIIGLYISRISDEVKQRPNYIVEHKINL